MSQTPPPFQFETSFERLEKIVQELNSGALPLEEALKIYEEANELITICGKKLSQAEQKVELLIQKRNNEIETTPFQSN